MKIIILSGLAVASLLLASCDGKKDQEDEMRDVEEQSGQLYNDDPPEIEAEEEEEVPVPVPVPPTIPPTLEIDPLDDDPGDVVEDPDDFVEDPDDEPEVPTPGDQ